MCSAALLLLRRSLLPTIGPQRNRSISERQRAKDINYDDNNSRSTVAPSLLSALSNRLSVLLRPIHSFLHYGPPFIDGTELEQHSANSNSGELLFFLYISPLAWNLEGRIFISPAIDEE